MMLFPWPWVTLGEKLLFLLVNGASVQRNSPLGITSKAPLKACASLQTPTAVSTGLSLLQQISHKANEVKDWRLQ